MPHRERQHVILEHPGLLCRKRSACTQLFMAAVAYRARWPGW